MICPLSSEEWEALDSREMAQPNLWQPFPKEIPTKLSRLQVTQIRPLFIDFQATLILCMSIQTLLLCKTMISRFFMVFFVLIKRTCQFWKCKSGLGSGVAGQWARKSKGFPGQIRGTCFSRWKLQNKCLERRKDVGIWSDCGRERSKMFDRINWVEGRSKTLSLDGRMDLM